MMRNSNILFSSILAAAIATSTPTPAIAASYEFVSSVTGIVGKAHSVSALQGEDFASVALTHELGFDALVAANPGINPWFPVAGSTITLPTQHILPDVEQEGIVINLPEMRLYYFDTHNDKVHTYPVGIGRSGWETPIADVKVTAVEHNPAWRPPQSIIDEYQEAGLKLPSIVPPGPDNPLGEHAIRLDLPGYLIHGTNEPAGVGMRVSHGCIRLFPNHIRELAGLVSSGTRVQIINQPIKWVKSAHGLQLEAHRPIPMGKYIKTSGHSQLVTQSQSLKKWLADKRNKQALFNGIPQPVPEF